MSAYKEDDHRVFAVKDILRLTGLSSSQFRNWAARGAIPPCRSDGARRPEFSERELFVTMVCVEMRRVFHVSLESLRWLQSQMMRPPKDPFRVGVMMLIFQGAPIYICTDMKSALVMGTELQFSDVLKGSLFGWSAPDHFMSLKVSALLSKTFAACGGRGDFREHRFGDKLARAIDEQHRAQSPVERGVLRLMRDNTTRRIQMDLVDGTVKTVYAIEDIPVCDAEDLQKLTGDHEYQTVTLSTVRGKVVRSQRKLPLKFGKCYGSESSSAAEES